MKNLNGKTVLITAGPTREYIDPVRYISNDSSGQMGYALAETAMKAGANVILISGPVNLKQPQKIECINVISAKEMFGGVKKNFSKADIIICAAAVADWRPQKISNHKIKKRLNVKHSNIKRLILVENHDILAWCGKNKRRGQCVVGFALETDNLIKNAILKLRKKKCDYIVANHSSAIAKKSSSVAILDAKGNTKKIGPASKKAIAKEILTSIV